MDVRNAISKLPDDFKIIINERYDDLIDKIEKSSSKFNKTELKRIISTIIKDQENKIKNIDISNRSIQEILKKKEFAETGLIRLIYRFSNPDPENLKEMKFNNPNEAYIRAYQIAKFIMDGDLDVNSSPQTQIDNFIPDNMDNSASWDNSSRYWQIFSYLICSLLDKTIDLEIFRTTDNVGKLSKKLTPVLVAPKKKQQKKGDKSKSKKKGKQKGGQSPLPIPNKPKFPNKSKPHNRSKSPNKSKSSAPNKSGCMENYVHVFKNVRYVDEGRQVSLANKFNAAIKEHLSTLNWEEYLEKNGSKYVSVRDPFNPSRKYRLAEIISPDYMLGQIKSTKSRDKDKSGNKSNNNRGQIRKEDVFGEEYKDIIVRELGKMKDKYTYENINLLDDITDISKLRNKTLRFLLGYFAYSQEALKQFIIQLGAKYDIKVNVKQLDEAMNINDEAYLYSRLPDNVKEALVKIDRIILQRPQDDPKTKKMLELRNEFLRIQYDRVKKGIIEQQKKNNGDNKRQQNRRNGNKRRQNRGNNQNKNNNRQQTKNYGNNQTSNNGNKQTNNNGNRQTSNNGKNN